MWSLFKVLPPFTAEYRTDLHERHKILAVNRILSRIASPMLTYVFNSSKSHTFVSMDVYKIWINTHIHSTSPYLS